MNDEEKRLSTIGRLCAGTGHNIMTPLSLIMMHNDMLALKLKGEDAFQKHVGEIGEQARRLTKIAELMMWKTQVEQQDTPSAIQVGVLVQNNLDFWLGDMTFKHDLEKTFNINSQTPPVQGIPFHYTSFMDEWIVLLIKRTQAANGVKFSVRVEVESQKEFSLSFTDTARSLSEEQLTALKTPALEVTPRQAAVFPAMYRFLTNNPTAITLADSSSEKTTLTVLWKL